MCIKWLGGRTKDKRICLGLKVGCGLDGMKSGGHRVLIWHVGCTLRSKSRVWGRTGVWGIYKEKDQLYSPG